MLGGKCCCGFFVKGWAGVSQTMVRRKCYISVFNNPVVGRTEKAV